jgi:photosystem II stability/assembly factor-like uncharacterized protein
MKKYFNKTSMIFLLLFALSVQECDSDDEPFSIIMAALSNFPSNLGKYPNDQNGFTIISVGENGKIIARAGRPPADWMEVESGTTHDLNFVKTYSYPFYSIACVVGDSGTVLYSKDRGQTWENLSITSLTQNLYGLNFIDYDYNINKALIIACGESGVVYRSYISTDTVWTWEQVNTPTTQRLNSITSWLGLYLVAGDNGTILRSTDHGQHWEDKSVGGGNLNRIVIDEFQIFPTRAWIVGDSGKIYRTTDIGVTWELKNSGTAENLYDLSFRTSYEGVAVGAKGVVKYTTDAGSSWNDDPELSSITKRDIISIAGVDTVTATAITMNNYSRNKKIKKSQGTDTTFIITVSSEPFVNVHYEENSIPSQFILEQNYPNPFNPSTKISWQLPEGSNVKLKVFDLLGREVATLVDEYRQAGSYDVEFNQASSIKNPASGVYYYQLKAGNLIETKKMILLK